MKLFGVVLVIISLSLGVYFDKHLFPYGKNNLDIYSSIPLGIKPEYKPDFEGGFTLRDMHGLSLISKNARYSELDIIVADFLKYGFNNDEIVVEVIDKHRNTAHLLFKKNENASSNRDISVSIINYDENINIDKYNWVTINENQNFIEILRNIVFLIALFLIVFIFSKWIKGLKIN